MYGCRMAGYHRCMAGYHRCMGVVWLDIDVWLGYRCMGVVWLDIIDVWVSCGWDIIDVWVSYGWIS